MGFGAKGFWGCADKYIRRQGTEAKAPEDVRQARVPLLKLLGTLNTAQKISLAVKGNKEARALLVRDHNRVIASAAIRNPRITEQEVVLAAASKSVADEVVRVIAKSKELSRPYAVKRALVYNPKCPTPDAMHLLTLLRANDVRDVAKSKNVPSAVAAQHVTPSTTLAREVLDLPEPAAPVPASRSGSVRGSGILSPGVGLVKSREKMINAWPRVADYLITEFR